MKEKVAVNPATLGYGRLTMSLSMGSKPSSHSLAGTFSFQSVKAASNVSILVTQNLECVIRVLCFLNSYELAAVVKKNLLSPVRSNGAFRSHSQYVVCSE